MIWFKEAPHITSKPKYCRCRTRVSFYTAVGDAPMHGIYANQPAVQSYI